MIGDRWMIGDDGDDGGNFVYTLVISYIGVFFQLMEEFRKAHQRMFKEGKNVLEKVSAVESKRTSTTAVSHQQQHVSPIASSSSAGEVAETASAGELTSSGAGTAGPTSPRSSNSSGVEKEVHIYDLPPTPTSVSQNPFECGV